MKGEGYSELNEWKQAASVEAAERRRAHERIEELETALRILYHYASSRFLDPQHGGRTDDIEALRRAKNILDQEGETEESVATIIQELRVARAELAVLEEKVAAVTPAKKKMHWALKGALVAGSIDLYLAVFTTLACVVGGHITWTAYGQSVFAMWPLLVSFQPALFAVGAGFLSTKKPNDL